MMPAKFNRKLWVRRGGYLIIEPSLEGEQDANSRVTGTICTVSYDEHIKQLRKMPGVWLSEFANANQTAAAPTGDNFMRPSDSESSASADEPEAGTTVADWHHPQQVYQQELLQQQQQLHQQQTDSRAPISINTGAVAAVDLAAKLDSSSLGHRGSGKHSSSRGQVAGGNVPQQGHCDSCSSEEEDDSLPPLQQINNRRVHYELSDDSDSLDE
eukprot:GHUV01050954.1.p1 GENE.GHUV01050954.1~~GHUV01050954.1.p1  ORF type:complete len:213 (+),score=64.13 GHUV01050954.1:141-779(+)